MTAPARTVLIVGGSGYLGGELARHLQEAGWSTSLTARHPQADDRVRYSLGDDFPPGALAGLDGIIHCAYDFGPTRWKDIEATNVDGTRRLLAQAAEAGVKTFITISSISAFPGCRSLYGRAKLLIEDATLDAGGIVLRPGLIHGGTNRGMFGRLLASVETGRPVPLLAGSPCTQYLVHVDDLSCVIERLLSGTIPLPASAWTVAHPRPWPLRDLLVALAAPRNVRFLPVPWQAVWLVLRAAEMLGLTLPFKSDSVRSIVHQNPAPNFSQVAAAGVSLREFRPTDSPR